MENDERIMKIYTIVTGKELKKTIILAKNRTDAIKKFFKSFINLRDAVLENEIGASIVVYDGKISKNFPTIPFLVVLSVISEEEAVTYMTNNSQLDINFCLNLLRKSVQNCQWLGENDEVLSGNC